MCSTVEGSLHHFMKISYYLVNSIVDGQEAITSSFGSDIKALSSKTYSRFTPFLKSGVN